MNSEARKLMQRLIQSEGELVCADKTRCEGFIRDYCVNYKPEANVLVSALRAGCVDKLRDRVSLPIATTIGRQVARLETEHGMASAPAHWAVETWAIVLGIASDSDFARTPEVPPLPPEPVPLPPVPPAPPVTPVAPPVVSLPVAPVAAPIPPRRPRWRYLVSMALGLVFTGYQWSSSNERVAALSRQLDACSTESTKLNGQVMSLTQAAKQVASDGPVSVGNINIWNADEKGHKIGSASTSFNMTDIKYIDFDVVLKNNLVNKEDVNGVLEVKYIKPDGSMSTGTVTETGDLKQLPSYTYGLSVTLPAGAAEKHISHGWGNEAGGSFVVGRHRIEFWWNDRKIGQKEFDVL